jgi:hypothetical protein
MGETSHLIIGHRRPDFSYPQPWRFVTDQPHRNDDFQVPPGTSDRNLPDDSVIGEYHHLFKVADSLSSSNPSSQVRIAQYRRLVLNKPVGTPSTNQPWTRIVTPSGADALSLNELTEPDSSGFLLSSVLPVHSIIRDFGASHPSRDLFRFLSDCVDAGLLTSKQLTEIAEFNALIPAPSNGTFPTEFFIRSMALLRRAAVAFCQSGYSPSTGYDQRCVAFCLERLNSCLIFIELARLNIDVRKVVGHQVTISETAAVSLTGR